MKFWTTKVPFFTEDVADCEAVDIQYDELKKMNEFPDWQLDENNKQESAVALLHQLAYCNRLEGVKKALAANVPLTSISKQGTSLLTSAARGNAVDVMDYLIMERKFTPSFQSPSVTENVLHKACRQGDIALVDKTLAMPGIKIDMPELARQRTGLHLALDCGHFALASHLLSLGADPLARDKENKTALATVLGYFDGKHFSVPNIKDIQLHANLCQQLMQTENPFSATDRHFTPASLFMTDQIIINLNQYSPKLLQNLLELASKSADQANEKQFIEKYQHLKSVDFKLTPGLTK